MDAVAWVLNLDADLELGSSDVKGYAPTKAVRAAMAAMIPRVASTLLRPGDVLLDEDPVPGAASGLRGRAFCPTPRAIALLERAGAVVDAHPSVDVLRAVNSRAFATRIGPILPHAAFVTDRAAAMQTLATRPVPFEAWRVKREHGMTGRGHRVIPSGELSAADAAFVDAALAVGGLQLEPNVPIVVEYGKHAMLSSEGDTRLHLGKLVRQRCDARGAWLATEAIEEPTDDELAIDTALVAQATAVGHALDAAGYFGPFGIDAFTYRIPDGTIRLHAQSEINARYSMGFGIGFGLGR